MLTWCCRGRQCLVGAASCSLGAVGEGSVSWSCQLLTWCCRGRQCLVGSASCSLDAVGEDSV